MPSCVRTVWMGPVFISVCYARILLVSFSCEFFILHCYHWLLVHKIYVILILKVPAEVIYLCSFIWFPFLAAMHYWNLSDLSKFLCTVLCCDTKNLSQECHIRFCDSSSLYLLWLFLHFVTMFAKSSCSFENCIFFLFVFCEFLAASGN